MQQATVILLASFALSFAAISEAQVAGRTRIAVAVAVEENIALGLSAKKQILGQAVYNQTGDKVGAIDDLVVAPDNSVSFAIIGVGGFVGVRKHRVAIPVELLLNHDGGFILLGATKEALKTLPAFDYARPIERDDNNPVFRR